jgi:predicted CXXCH cytochrome family protein
MTGLLISPAIVTGESHSDFELPEIKKKCTLCHISSRLEEETRLIRPVSELCAGCHPDRITSSEHSVDVIPSMFVEELPLSPEGKITCVTCHDPHRNLYGTMLRIKTEILCQICHKK